MEKITVYTDGSCSNKYGGIGVYFPDYKQYNISKKFTDTTNQRMELSACIYAIEKAIEIGKENNILWDLTIYSDSMYTIKCITEWAPIWIKYDWGRKVGNKVKKNLSNLDIIKKLYMLSCMYQVKYIHVKSHQKEPNKNDKNWDNWYGNYCADKLAYEANNM